MPVTVNITPAAAGRGDAVGTKDQHGGGRSDTGRRELAEREHRDQKGHRVKHGDVHADGVQHQPVARDLGAHG